MNVSDVTVRAEMVRRGLLANQRQRYEDPERGMVDPSKDPEVIQGAWEFLRWLETAPGGH